MSPAWGAAMTHRRFRSTTASIAALQGERAAAVVTDAAGGRARFPNRPRERRRTPVASDPYNGARTTRWCGDWSKPGDWTRHHRHPESQRTARPGRRGISDRHQVGGRAQRAGNEKYVVCNADESEPGTIKDRFIMEQPAAPGDRRHDHRRPGDRRAEGHPLYPARVREPEKRFCRKRSSAATAKGCWGRTSWARDLTFELEIFVSPGGYICGEESALIEAIEGKRAEPRNKPPFPGDAGRVEQADRAEQCGDVRQCAADSGERRGLVQGAGTGRRGRFEIRRRQRRCERPGSVRDSHGHCRCRK